ncbi:MAG: LamG-like jellyroll fold domain-containing protein [Acidobacteriota bacterium]
MLNKARLCGLGVLPLFWVITTASGAAETGLRQALTFYASFDGRTEADFALGDSRLHTATSYQKRDDARPGLHAPDVLPAKGKGRFGDALSFRKKNAHAVYYPAEKNVAFNPKDWNGTVSFWLSLDPETDLEPGYCDPIQLTDKDYNDSAVWVDFTKDDKPRHFRLGVFGELKVWNPKNIGPDENPAFKNRLVVVQKTPFARGGWTHVVVTYEGLGKPGGGKASLYLNGQLQGTSETIRESFSWDRSRAAIRLGLSYVGLYDELALFNRALTSEEVRTLYQLDQGVRSLLKP